jgi:hypothetical protein
MRAFEGRKEKLGSDHPSTQFSHYLLNRFEQRREQWAGEIGVGNMF